MTVKISAKLTKEEQAMNGLDAIRARLCGEDDLMYGDLFLVVKAHVTGKDFDVDTGEWNATIKLDHIEPDLADKGLATKERLAEIYRERAKRPEDPQGTLPFPDDGSVSDRTPDEWLDDAVAGKE